MLVTKLAELSLKKERANMNLKAKKLDTLFKTKADWCKNNLAIMSNGAGSGRVYSEPYKPGADVVSMCLAGGAMQVRGGYGKSDGLITTMAQRIREIFPKRVGIYGDWITVVDFNNHPETTFADIKKVIKGL